MLIIGLAGGRPDAREEIIERLMRSANIPFKRYEDRHRREPGPRCNALALHLGKTGPHAKRGVVVAQVLTEAEAELIRARGGVMWHVMGWPSESVAFQRDKGDQWVTHFQGGCRHFLDPLEALSEALLAKRKG